MPQLGKAYVSYEAKGLDKLHSDIGGASSAFKAGAAVIVGSVAAITAAVVKIGVPFEQMVVDAGSAMRATAKEMEALEAAARKAGATTEHTATQAAESLMFLGKAGLSAGQAMAALPGMMNFKTAIGDLMSLGQATDVITDSMTAMGLEVKDLSHLTDLFIGVSNRSSINAAQVGESFTKVAGIARLYGTSVEDLTSLLGVLGSAGIKAEMAGTGLKNAFINTSKAARALGIENTGLIDTLKAVKDANWDADQIAKTYGRIALPSVVAVLKSLDGSGPGSLSYFQEELSHVSEGMGESAAQAEKMRATLGNQFKVVVSQIEDIALSIYDKWLPAMMAGVKSTQDFLKENKEALVGVADAFVPLLEIVGVGGALILGMKAAAVVIPTVTFATEVMSAAMVGGAATTGALNTTLFGTSLAAKAATGSLGMVSIAAGSLFAAFAGWKIGQFLYDEFEAVRLISLTWVDALMAGWIEVEYGAKMAWAGVKTSFAVVTGEMMKIFSAFIDGAAEGFKALGQFDLAGDLTRTSMSIKMAVRDMGDLADSVNVVAGERKKALSVHSQTIDSLIKEAKTYGTVKKEAGMSAKEIKKALGERVKMVEMVADATVKAGKESVKISKAVRKEKKKSLDGELKDFFGVLDAAGKRWTKHNDEMIKDRAAMAREMERLEAGQFKEFEKQLKESQKSYEQFIADTLGIKEISNESWLKLDKIYSDAFVGVMSGEVESFDTAMADMLDAKELSVESLMKNDELYSIFLAEQEKENKRIRMDFFETTGGMSEEYFAKLAGDIEAQAGKWQKAGVDAIAIEEWKTGEFQKLDIKKLESSDSFFSGIQRAILSSKQDVKSWGDVGEEAFGTVADVLKEGIVGTIDAFINGGGSEEMQKQLAGLRDEWEGLQKSIEGVNKRIIDIEVQTQKMVLEANRKTMNELELFQSIRQEYNDIAAKAEQELLLGNFKLAAELYEGAQKVASELQKEVKDGSGVVVADLATNTDLSIKLMQDAGNAAVGALKMQGTELDQEMAEVERKIIETTDLINNRGAEMGRLWDGVWKGMLDSVIKNLSQMAAEWAAQEIAGLAVSGASALAGLFSGAPSAKTGAFDVGQTGPGQSLAGGVVPILAHTGESILPADLTQSLKDATGYDEWGNQIREYFGIDPAEPNGMLSKAGDYSGSGAALYKAYQAFQDGDNTEAARQVADAMAQGLETYAGENSSRLAGGLGQGFGGIASGIGAYQAFENDDFVQGTIGAIQTIQQAAAAYSALTASTINATSTASLAAAEAASTTGAGALSESLAGTVKSTGYGAALWSAIAMLSGDEHLQSRAAATGATVGATVGSYVPVVGTYAGAVIGGAIGSIYDIETNRTERFDLDELDRYINDRRSEIPAGGVVGYIPGPEGSDTFASVQGTYYNALNSQAAAVNQFAAETMANLPEQYRDTFENTLKSSMPTIASGSDWEYNRVENVIGGVANWQWNKTVDAMMEAVNAVDSAFSPEVAGALTRTLDSSRAGAALLLDPNKTAEKEAYAQWQRDLAEQRQEERLMSGGAATGGVVVPGNEDGLLGVQKNEGIIPIKAMAWAEDVGNAILSGQPFGGSLARNDKPIDIGSFTGALPGEMAGARGAVMSEMLLSDTVTRIGEGNRQRDETNRLLTQQNDLLRRILEKRITAGELTDFMLPELQSRTQNGSADLNSPAVTRAATSINNSVNYARETGIGWEQYG